MSDELTWMPAWQIRERIGAREISCKEVLDHFLDRIEQLNPVLHAFEQLDVAGARAQAEGADRAVRDGEPLGPLHGIPTSVKCHIHVKGMRITPMSFAPPTEALTAGFDDVSVERLRKAGAIIVGTNTMMGAGGGGRMDPERPGIFKPFDWEAEARSPWDTRRVPGWSSAGGAAAAAARLLPFTIGSDGGGSTRLPAAYSGVVGLHTSRGLIPHIDYDQPRLLFTASLGPLARYVRDVALVTAAIGGPDGRDYVSLQEEPRDCLAHIDDGVDDLRIAWTEDFGFASRYSTPDTARIIEVARQAAQALRTLGATLETTAEIWEDRSEKGIARWMAEPSSYEVMVGANLVPLQKVDPALYREQAESRARNWEKFRRLFRDYDVITSVTAQRVADTTEVWDRNWTVNGPSVPGGSFAATYCSHTMIFNWLGFPAISVPCGFVDGLPVGLQIAAWHGREDLVLRVANAFQRAFPRSERPAVS
jgi:amidase/aspartyl-tRNA(Asn)/glutamyl-tRNA(Gln) amidotransferase subunit A